MDSLRGKYKLVSFTIPKTNTVVEDAKALAASQFSGKTYKLGWDKWSFRDVYKTIYHPAVEAYDETVNRTLEVVHHDAVAAWTETTNEVEATYLDFEVRVYKYNSTY